MDISSKIHNEHNALNSYALQLTKNSEDANDLVQETMLKALTYQTKFKEGTNLKGWLYTIMRNSFIDTTDNTYFLDSANHSTENGGESKFLAEDIQEAIATLPEDLKITFELNMEGFKYHEIAEELDIPIGTVKTRIFVAKRRLRKQLKSYSSHYGFDAK